MMNILTLRNAKQLAWILIAIAAALVVVNYGLPLAHAQSTMIDPMDNPDNVSQATGGEDSARALARTIINFFLYFLGFVATVMIIAGGATYVTAAGAQEKVDNAKKMITYAVVGIIIILLSFAVVNTVLQSGLEGNQPTV